LPFTATKIRELLNISNLQWSDAFSGIIMAEGHSINKATLLFDKIEDDAIKFQVDKLEATKLSQLTVSSTEEETASALKPIKDVITYDDFAKLDVRVGTILTAEKVEKADKLLKLTIDIGLEVRTVVSGIALHFKPEDIIGQQVTLLANLAPRKLKGIESNGMILMAEDKDGKLIFVQPSALVSVGSTIS
jgi:methionyl-tRNA synthetase